VKFGFVAKHRGIWPVAWICEALGVSRAGFYTWLRRSPSRRLRDDEILSTKVRESFTASDRTYGARRVWHDLLAEGFLCGLHRIERLMKAQALRARPRRRRFPRDMGARKPTPSDSMFSIEDSMRRRPIANGWPTSLTSGPPRAGCMWRR